MAKAASRNKDLGILLIRIAIGLVFVAHGWDKVSDLSGTATAMSGLGIPAVLAYAVSFAEFLGGIAFVAGLWTRWVGVLLAVVMAIAIALVKIKLGYVGGYEYELTLLLGSLGIALTGSGAFSVEKIALKGR
jgi:putative oxidoreductase